MEGGAGFIVRVIDVPIDQTTLGTIALKQLVEDAPKRRVDVGATSTRRRTTRRIP